ncbi:hypothetical protein Hanom_Chr08g00713021 [Helianthus anomalus]
MKNFTFLHCNFNNKHQDNAITSAKTRPSSNPTKTIKNRTKQSEFRCTLVPDFPSSHSVSLDKVDDEDRRPVSSSLNSQHISSFESMEGLRMRSFLGTSFLILDFIIPLRELLPRVSIKTSLVT